LKINRLSKSLQVRKGKCRWTLLQGKVQMNNGAANKYKDHCPNPKKPFQQETMRGPIDQIHESNMVNELVLFRAAVHSVDLRIVARQDASSLLKRQKVRLLPGSGICKPGWRLQPDRTLFGDKNETVH